MAFLSLENPAIRLTVFLLTAALFSARADGEGAGEYQVKAVFLLNFARFVEWPAQAFKSTGDPIRICVLGENSFDSALEEAIRGKTVANRTFVLNQISTAREAADCHIVFMAAAERKRVRGVLGEIKGLNILTVGETEDFIATGGVVRFMLKDSHVRFEIDADAAARANLKISSKLMSLAENRRR